MAESDQDEKLTPEARDAIRKYLIRLVTLPGIVVSLLMFLLGYLINDVARKDAYNDAYTRVSERVLNLAMQTGKAADDAQRSRDQIETAKNTAVSAQTELTKIRDDLRTADATLRAATDATKLTKEITDTLLANDSFKQSIKLAISQTGQITKVGYGNGVHEWKQMAAQCPPGNYVAGIEVDYGGTCRNECGADGAVIREIRLVCKASI